MPDPIRFYFDHNMWDAVAEGLRRRGIDVVLAREVGLEEADDPDQLAFATTARRVMVTFDTDYQSLHRSGVTHAGIAWFKLGKHPVGDMIDLLELLALTFTYEQMQDRLEYF